MIERGKIARIESEDEILLERRMLTRVVKLILSRDQCIGCGICVDMCPKEAIEYSPSVFEGRKSLNRPSIDFKSDDCVLCGECVISCPVKALTMLVEGEEKTPVVEFNVFASLIKRR